MANPKTITIAGKQCPVLFKKAQGIPTVGTNALDQVAQQSGALASNPATGQALGLQNMQMSGGATQGEGMPKADILKMLDHIGACAPSDAIKHKAELESALNQVQDIQWRERLAKLLNAMQFNKNLKQQQVNPANGEKDPTAPQIAQNLAKELRPTVNNEKTSYTASTQRTAAEEHPQVHKKKKRGNPFRVLMGKVGKLLDHGVEKHDIVRQLHKQMDFFTESTIAKAVDIVKDYNRKDVIGDEIAKGSGEETENTEDMNRPLYIQPSPVVPQMQFASSRLAQADGQSQAKPQDRPEASKTVYDAKPDWSKRSTGELIFRLQTLTKTPKEAMGRDTGKGNAIPIPKATSEANAIRSALVARGFDQKEVDGYLEKVDRLPIEKDQ